MSTPITAVSVLTGVSMLIGLSEGADAAVIAQTQEFSLKDDTPTLSDDRTGEYTATAELTFDAFDANLGTLSAVEFAWTSTGAIDVDAHISYDGPGDNVLAVLSGTNSLHLAINDLAAGTLTDSEEIAADASCQSATGTFCNVALKLNAPYDESISAGDPGAFQAPGGGSFTVDFLFDALAELTFPDGDENVEGIQFPFGAGSDLASWTGEFTVAFTYEPAVTPVPEPGTLGLLGAGLAGLGAAAAGRRRRKA
jgi:hypothetical protein